MSEAYEIASGTMTGRRHLGAGRLLIGRNNQDAWCFLQRPELTIAVVCDGCSSCAASEVGAKIGARLVMNGLEASVRALGFDGGEEAGRAEATTLLRSTKVEVLKGLESLVSLLGGDAVSVIREHLLFTILAVVVTKRKVLVFSRGDGFFAINGEVRRIGPFPENAPPYLAYELLDPGMVPAAALPAEGFSIEAFLPVEEVETLLIATDGIAELIDAEHLPLPGRKKRVGPLSQFWTKDFYFENADAVRRQLALVNSQSPELDSDGAITWRSGHLTDDTTLVVLRKRHRGAGRS